MKTFLTWSAAFSLGISGVSDCVASAVLPLSLASTIVLVNGGKRPARATVSYRNSAGKLTAQTKHQLAAKGVAVVPVPVPKFDGAVSIAANQPVAALALTAGGSDGAREVYEGSATGTRFWFPIFEHLNHSAQTSLITVQNVRTQGAVQATLRYFDARGTEKGTLRQRIPAAGSYTFDSVALFGDTSVIYAAEVEANGAVAVAERFGLIRPATGTVTEAAGLPGLDPDRLGTALLLNHVRHEQTAATGVTRWSQVTIANGGSAPAEVTVRFYAADGTRKGVGRRTIPPHGFASVDTRRLKLERFDGYARVSQIGLQPLAVQALEFSQSGKAVSGLSGVPEQRGAATWGCADARRVAQAVEYTRFQIVNMSAAAGRATVQLHDPSSGALLVAKSYAVKAGKRLTVGLASDVYAALGVDYHGLAVVKAPAGGKLIVSAYTDRETGGAISYNCAALP